MMGTSTRQILFERTIVGGWIQSLIWALKEWWGKAAK